MRNITPISESGKSSLMKTSLYNPILLETLIPESILGIALFLKQKDNYVLYKHPDLPFTIKDKDRLINSNVSELYVYSSELSTYNQYVEANLSMLLSSTEYTVGKRQEILCHSALNYLHEVFEQPAIAVKQNLSRVKQIIQYILSDYFSPTQLLETLGGLIQHNPYMYVHSLQVSTYMSSFYHTLGCTEQQLIDITVGAIFHDYGKVYIPAEILDKPERLTAAEFEIVKQHSEYGYQALTILDEFSDLSLEIIRYHHEKMDGSGYPKGLTGKDIPRHAKIAAIVDVYCALTTDRSYRLALPKHEALEIMQDQMKGSFDGYYLSMFTAMLG